MALIESNHAGEFVLSEANGSRSRETVTLLSGQNLKAGAVLGKITLGAATAAAAAGNTGNGTCSAVVRGATAKPGVYRVTFVEPATNLGTFVVEDPDGVIVGSGVVGTQFTGGGLTFTISDGATDFVAGDAFTITVAAGSGKYVAIDKDNTDGSQNAAAVLYEACDASAADKKCAVIVRDAELLASSLNFNDLNAGQITTAKAQLAALGIIVREAI